MAKVILVTPDYHCGVVESAGKWPNLAFVYLAGHLRKAGHEVKIYDAMSKDHNLTQIMEHIKSFEPDVVATTAYTASFPAALEILKETKKYDQDLITVIGGSHVTFEYDVTLSENDYVDYIVRYEGEETFPALLEALAEKQELKTVKGIAFREKDQIIATDQRAFIPNLDNLIPAWDLVDWKDYTFFVYPGSSLAIVSTSRGCMHDCKFCSQQKFWQRSWRARSVESITSEIKYLVKKYKIDVFFISDEYPTSDRERWESMLDKLIEMDLGCVFLMETRVDDILRDEDIMGKYLKAGIIHIYVGIEATDQETLNRFNKGIEADDSKRALDIIHSAGIVTETSFVLGGPEETYESIQKTLAMAKKYNPDFGHFLLLAPWPYADMYDDLKGHIESYDYSKYNLVEPVIKPDAMTTEELFEQVLKCYKSFYYDKIPEWANLEDGFKKDYALHSMRAIMDNSFLKEHVLKFGTMPKMVEDILKDLAGEKVS